MSTRVVEAAVMTGDGLEWYVLFVRGRKEELVRHLLSRMGFGTFLPRFERSLLRRGRWIVVRRPLFPNYLFVATDLARDQRLAILRIPGVLRLLGEGDHPTPVPPEQIESLRQLVTEKAPLQPYPYLRTGQKVVVVSGPFKGVIGLLIERRGQSRLVISVDVMGRSVSTTVDVTCVEPYY